MPGLLRYALAAAPPLHTKEGAALIASVPRCTADRLSGASGTKLDFAAYRGHTDGSSHFDPLYPHESFMQREAVVFGPSRMRMAVSFFLKLISIAEWDRAQRRVRD